MFFSEPVDFPEFEVEPEKIYVLDITSKDDEELEKRGENLVTRKSMDVTDFKIRKKQDYYGLYVA